MPRYLGDEHWHSIATEVTQLDRSLSTGDWVQAIGDVKCLIEAVAKVTLDIAGEPAAPNDSLDKVLKAAHDRLTKQPGHELTHGSEFGNIATQANKIARNLSATFATSSAVAMGGLASHESRPTWLLLSTEGSHGFAGHYSESARSPRVVPMRSSETRWNTAPCSVPG